MIHKSRPIFSAQFHPEAKGGPLDSSCKFPSRVQIFETTANIALDLFDAYINSVGKYKKTQAQFQPGKEQRPSPILVDLMPKERVGVHPSLPDWTPPKGPGIVAPRYAPPTSNVAISAAA
jgi:carbamoyl-phosphate synthase small subunit